MITNIKWVNTNSLRKYPIKDTCSGVDNNGNTLPNDIIADINLIAPNTISSNPVNKIFISSVGISKNIVSVTLAIEDGSNFTPIAAVSVGPSLVVGKNYQLKPLLDGVSGWISFGYGIGNTTGNFVFSTYAQTGLLDRCVRQYKAHGVTSLSRKNKTGKLVGDIVFKSPNKNVLDISCIPSSDPEARYINGAYRDCVVFKLNKAASGPNIYKQFIGPCDVSPDSGTCNKPVIYTINDAVPDCSGLIHFTFMEEVASDFGQLLYITIDGNKVYFNFCIGMADVCARSSINFNDAQIMDYRCYDQCAAIDPGPFAGSSNNSSTGGAGAGGAGGST